ncbi:MAG: DUF1934 domain-containing protein [Bacilli bacterium]
MTDSNIILTITTVQELEDQREEHYTQVPALLKIKGDETWIAFKEQIGKETIPTVYRFSSDSIKIIRNGTLKMNHQFKQNEKTMSDYRSPFGVLQMETETNALSLQDSNIRIHYDLYVGGDFVSKNAISAAWTYVS